MMERVKYRWEGGKKLGNRGCGGLKRRNNDGKEKNG